MASILEKYTREFAVGHELASGDAEPVLDALIAESDEMAIANLLMSWNTKGIEENEIYEFSRLLRSRMKRVNSRHETFVDIVGTGGSKAKTFNVSTAAAFVVAGAGVPVAKHGNKAATSNSGSADVLAELGVDPAVDPEAAEKCLNEIGICFMFAPNHHRLSSTLGKVRRGLGFPTIFNCVGPLCNPASAPHQLIGVWDKELLPKIAGTLARLGTQRSWIVNGNGLDELSLDGTTSVAEVTNGAVSFAEMNPDAFGLEPCNLDEIRCRDAVASSAVIREVLEGRATNPAAENIVILNAAGAIAIAQPSLTPLDAAERACESIRSKSALRKLEDLAAAAPV